MGAACKLGLAAFLYVADKQAVRPALVTVSPFGETAMQGSFSHSTPCAIAFDCTQCANCAASAAREGLLLEREFDRREGKRAVPLALHFAGTVTALGCVSGNMATPMCIRSPR